MMVNFSDRWTRPALSAAAALVLLAGCNAPAPQPEPPPQAEAPPEAPPPALLGGPQGADDNHLAGNGAYATPETAGPLTTFRRADGVLVTVMRPIPNPDEARPARVFGPSHRHVRHPHGVRRHRLHHHAGHQQKAAPARQAPVRAAPAAQAVIRALPPTRPLPAPKTVESPKPAPVATTGPTSALVQPPAVAPALPTPTPAAPAAPSWGDRFSGDSTEVPGLGTVSSRSFAGGMLVLLAMFIVVAIARRMAKTREARERAQAREARAGVIPSPETPVEPPASDQAPPA